MNNSKWIFTTGFILLHLIVFSQSFEGWVTYKLEMLNPLPELISDSDWNEKLKENLGERGYMIKKYYIKNGQYLQDIDAGLEQGYQLYNLADKKLYAWEKGSNEAVTSAANESFEQFIRIEDSEDVDTVAGIPCKSAILYFESGEIQIWYNSDYLKIDPSLFNDHKNEHWDQIFLKTRCMPLKIHRRFPSPVYIQTMMEYKAVQVSDEKFILPEFEEVSSASDY